MAALVGAFVVLVAVPAGAAPSCISSTGVVSVSLPTDGDAARIEVGTGSDAGRILFGIGDAALTSCGSATVINTDTVIVTGAAGGQSIRVSLAGGPFEPGATAEPSDSSEIEFVVDLGDGDDDELVIAGDIVTDRMVAGSDGVNLNAAEELDDVDVSLQGVEELALEGNAGGDTLSGAGGDGTGGGFTTGRLSLRGNAGDDTLTGGPGDDVLNGGEGADTLDGAEGIDTASYFGAPSGVVASLASGSASGGYGADTLIALENLTGSSFDDVLTGDAGENVLNGMGGADALEGLDGTDAARYLFAVSGVSVDLAAGTATGGDGNDTLSGIENVFGSDLDDVLTGDALGNQLTGGSGEDVISGAQGNDRLYGGAGDDRVHGGSGNDVVTGRGGSDELHGGQGNDALRGGTGDDSLLGGSGDDVLRGGPSTDSCDGGLGINQIIACEG